MSKIMIYLLFGEDKFTLKERMREIISQEGNKVREFDFTKDSFEEFKKEIFERNLFSEKVTFLLRNFFSLPLSEKELNFLSLEKENVFLFVEEQEELEDNFLFPFFKKIAKIEKFPKFSEEELKEWIKKKFEKFNKKIKEKELNLLLEYTGGDLWRLSREIEKLSLFEEKELITQRDIETLVSSEIEINTFSIIDSIFQKDKKKALFYLSKYFKKRGSPSSLFSLISNQVRNLLITRELIDKKENLFQIKKTLNLHPFLIKKLFYFAKRFEFYQIKELLLRIFTLEIKVKKGEITPENAIWFLISEI